MELEITQQFDNKLLHRKELQGFVTFVGATPSNADISLQIATKLSTGKELVVVDHIYNTYGAQEAKVFAKVYEKKDFLERYEPKKKEPKKKPGEQEGGEKEGKAGEGGKPPAEAAAPAEGKPEEKPTKEKPKEDKPAEGKPEEGKPEEKPEEGKKEEPPKEQSAPEAKEGKEGAKK